MSQIKGGGRASLSEETQEALAGLLLSIREPHINITSDHQRKHELKKFVKRLVARYERRSLAAQVNRDDGVASLESTASQLKIVEGQADNTKNDHPNQKVRIELIEAIFAPPKETSSKRSPSEKVKDNKMNDFKEGTKKIMALPRSTKVEDLMKEAKSKLRMKKNPTRCFIREKKATMVLVVNLSGIKDGTKVYVTSQEDPSEKDEPRKDDVKEKQDSNRDNADDERDPLEGVKQAYSRRKRPRNAKQSLMTGGEHPCFGSYLDKLPELSSERAKLPAASCRNEFLTAVGDQRVLIVCGATGSGKSTQIPPYILEGMMAAGQEHRAHILVTQPRRVAATSLARRVAQEMNSPPPGAKGSQVGYSVRLDRAVSDTAKIVYCTIGILLRMLVCPTETNDDFLDDASPDTDSKASQRVPLSSVTHVVIDEVHERDVNTDFVLTLLRRVLLDNKNIRVVLMSATASAGLFVRYFDEVGMKPSVIEIPGRMFPVDIHWISKCEQFAASTVFGWSPNIVDNSIANQNKTLSPRASDKIDNNFVCKLIRAIIQKQQTDGDLKAKNNESVRSNGAILVFLPGKTEIEALARALYPDELVGDRNICNILKLHSNVTKQEQQSVFIPAPVGKVKVVLATNIAETSITIPDVSHVIDTGRVKESRFNSETRIKELVTTWTSQASVKQRAGRAGRTSSGTCWRLYSEEFCNEMLPLQTCPEILRSPVDELVMQIGLLYEHKRDEIKFSNQKEQSKGVCPITFLSKTPEPPDDNNVVQACKHLLEVGALRIIVSKPRVLYRLTPLGYHLSRLPMDPKVGKVLLVGCMLGCLDNALTVAAALSATKACFLSRFSGAKDVEWQNCRYARKELIETGFGGPRWSGAAGGKNTVKGDLTATIASYRKWNAKRDRDRAFFCSKHAIDNVAMKEMSSLRSQFLDCLVDAGFVDLRSEESYNEAKDDALLTSCCLVAGLYPNICTLMRPRKGGPRGGRLITKDQDVCKTSSNSFQRDRLQNASESGKDAYAVFHSKHRSVGTGARAGEVFLSEVDFVSRFALLLFGGESVIENNALIVDSWLKFKVGENGSAMGALVLMLELRAELDNLLLVHVGSCKDNPEQKEHNQSLIEFVRQLLVYE